MMCDGSGDYSPPLVFRGVPDGTVELALSMVDEDKTSRRGDPLIQWVEWTIPAASAGLEEHLKPDEVREALSGLGEATYNGPCPPADQTRHYRFTLLADEEKGEGVDGEGVHAVADLQRPAVDQLSHRHLAPGQLAGGRGDRELVFGDRG